MGHQGHPRETNLPHDMGLPRPELAGRETGRGIYRRRWDIQGRRIYHMGLPRPELAGRETGRGFTAGGGVSKVGSGR